MDNLHEVREAVAYGADVIIESPLVLMREQVHDLSAIPVEMKRRELTALIAGLREAVVAAAQRGAGIETGVREASTVWHNALGDSKMDPAVQLLGAVDGMLEGEQGLLAYKRLYSYRGWNLAHLEADGKPKV